MNARWSAQHTLKAAVLAGLFLLAAVGPAYALLQGDLIVGPTILCFLLAELAATAFEAWYLAWMLQLRPFTAAGWSIAANMVSAILGPPAMLGVGWFFAFLLGDYWEEIPGQWLIAQLTLMTLVAAIVLECPILLLLNRRRSTSRQLLKTCVFMNLISVPMVVVAAYLFPMFVVDRLEKGGI